jgi:hypothetical protein
MERDSHLPLVPISYIRAEEARLIRRVESLEVHRAGLDHAIEPFGEKALDPERWRNAFNSNDPADVVARNGVTGCYSAVINGYVELLKSGAHLVGLTPHKKDRAKNAIDHVRDAGGITEKQAQQIHELYVFEGRVQHASPDVNADEVREAVELLRGEGPGLIRSAIRWLESNGVSIALK